MKIKTLTPQDGQKTFTDAVGEVRRTKQKVELHGFSLARYAVPKDLDMAFVDPANYGESRIVLSWPTKA